MAKFIVRVELHGVSNDADVYKKLHEKMAVYGFKRAIKERNKSYELLTAEYFNESNEHGIETILAGAKVACESINKPYSVFISEYTNVIWHNLKEI